jgi:membrane fusion protein (multidrug efflux system)
MKRILVLLALSALIACGGEEKAGGGRPGGPSSKGRGGPPGAGRGAPPAAAVPVEVASVERKTIASFIETNGSLEAENEVDLVARVSAPIQELLVEEGDYVRKGQTLARLDDIEFRVQNEIARVQVSETRQAFERAETLRKDDLIASEEYERAVSAHDSARAQLRASEIQFEFATLTAPFSGRIVRRYVDRAEQVSANTAIFRLSDFDPLLCPIQVPERELSRLRVDQPARLEVEAFPGVSFPSRVLRISPIVESETGTVKVTIVADTDRRLRPGMFARVYVEAERREGTLVVPKAALSLESIGDTIYVAVDNKASRREVSLGFRQGDEVEILSGVEAGEQVVVVGQDGLSDGTPLQIMTAPEDNESTAGVEPTEAAPREGRRARMDFSSMNEEQLEKVRERMRSRGMSDEEIEKIIKERKAASGGTPPAQAE